MNEQPLENLIRAIDVSLDQEKVLPEDSEKRFLLMHALEKELPAFSTLPKVSFDSPAAKICRLLWYKTHASQIDTDDVLRQILDTNPLVRITALEVLSATLNLSDAAWLDGKASYQLRTVLEQQHGREPSPFIGYKLDELLSQSPGRSRSKKRAISPALTNPYVAGPPIRHKEGFFGRQDVIREIQTTFGDGIGNTSSVVIHGARRTGKTSLLIRIAQGALGENFLPIYVDMQALVGTSLDAFLKTLIKLVEAKVPPKTDLRSIGTIDFVYFWDFLRRTLDRINPRCLAILFDEYEVLQDYIKNEGVARQLQSLAERDPKLFFIFAGATRLGTLKETNSILLFDASRYLRISFLQREEAYRLITEPVKDIIKFAPGVTDQILELCSGHPFYLQTCCQMLFELAKDRKIATSEDLEQTVQKFIESPAPHLVLSWKALEFHQKLTLAALAGIESGPAQHGKARAWASAAEVREYLCDQNYPIRLDHSEINRALSSLREEDWITKNEGEFTYRFAMDLVRRWIAEYRSLWDLLAAQQRSVLESAAGRKRRALAALMDLLLLMPSLLIPAYYKSTFFSIPNFFKEGLPTNWDATLWENYWVPLLVVVYFTTFIPVARGTPGMLLARLRVSSQAGGRLPLSRAILHGVLLSSPLICLVNALFLFDNQMFLAGWTLILAGLFLGCAHASVAYLGKSRRGLFDKLAGAVIVYAQEETK